jgi:hypothetical protein
MGNLNFVSPYLIGQEQFEREILAHSDLNEILEYI